MKKPKVSVIVLNYNGKKYLKVCFESLKKTTYPNFEVVMIDNKSTDDSVDYVKKNFKWVRIIDAGSNMGWAVGNNIGIKNTNGEYIVVLNNDTICTPNWLSELVNVIESDPQIGVVGSWPVDFVYMKCDLNKFPYKKIQEASTVSGAAMMIKRDVFEKIGLFEEKYFIYWEDMEFTWRTILCGYKVFTNYNSIVFHLTGGYTKKIEKERWIYEKVKNRIHTHVKLMNEKYLMGVFFEEILKLAFHFFCLPVNIIKKNPKSFRGYIKAWIWNIKNFKVTLASRRDLKKIKKSTNNKLIKLIIYDKHRIKRDYKFLDDLIKNLYY